MGWGKSNDVDSGFTIIEAVIVMAVLTILSVTALTKFNLGTRNLDAVGKALRSNIQFAQDLAMTNGSVYGFRSLNSTSYEIYNGAPGTPATNPHTRGSFTVNISPVQFFGVVPTVPFAASGVPSIAANAQIVLSEGGGTRTVTVEQNTGFVKMTSP